MHSFRPYIFRYIIVGFLLLLFNLAPLSSIYADSSVVVVTGTVYEKATRKPLAGASIYVIEQDEIHTVADSDGNFTLNISQSGVYPLQAVAFGFEKSFPVVLRIPDLNVSLKPVKLYLLPLTTLPEIVVVAERNEDRVGRTIITGNELKQVAGGGGDPIRALQTLPGIATTGEGSAEPAIRGSSPGDNAYYIDDVPVDYIYHVGGLVSVLPASVIDDFNLYTAAFGPQYDDVLGGIIDVGLREPRSDRLGGLIDVNLLSAEVLLEGPITKTQSFMFSVRRSYLDLVVQEIVEEEEDVRFSLPEYSDYLGRYVWDINTNNRLSAYLIGASDRVNFSIGKNSDAVKKEPAIVGDSDIASSYNTQAVTWDSQLANGVNNKLSVGHNLYRDKANIGSAFRNNIKFNSFYIREKLTVRPHPQHKLLLGADIKRWNIDIELAALNQNCSELQLCGPISSGDPVQLKTALNVFNAAIFIKDRWNFLPRYTFVSGIRYSGENYLDKSYLEPRLGIEWQHSKTTLLTAGWGIYNQFPDGAQILQNFGNPNLAHLRAQHSVMGVTHALNKDWLIKTEVFYKTFDNLVVGVADERIYANDADGKAYGWELFIKKNHTDNLWGWLSFTLSRSERSDDFGNTFVYDFDQPVISTLVTNYEFARHWTFGVKWQYHSGKPYDPIIGGELVRDEQGNPVDPPYYQPVYAATGKNSARLSPYHRLDVRIDRDWPFNTWKLKMYLEILNMYNRCNTAGYEYDVAYGIESKREVCGIPLIPTIGISAEF